MENLAHRKHITLNDITQPLVYSPQQTLLSYLIDGYDVPGRCTTIDSTRCRNNEPHITIDLNRNYYVHGVIIQQLSTCKNPFIVLTLDENIFFRFSFLVSHLSQDDYLSRFQLDRIIIHITRNMHLDAHQYNKAQCALVTRTNYSILTKCIHLQCQTPIIGRYIHIQLSGIRTVTNRTQTRLSLPFKAHFCEIFVYN